MCSCSMHNNVQLAGSIQRCPHASESIASITNACRCTHCCLSQLQQQTGSAVTVFIKQQNSQTVSQSTYTPTMYTPTPFQRRNPSFIRLSPTGADNDDAVLCPVCRRAHLVQRHGRLVCPAEGWQLNLAAESLQLPDVRQRLATSFQVSS